MNHDLKITPDYFQAQLSKIKTFEVRFNDRDFKSGDTVNLHEYLPNDQRYTGAKLSFKITYVLKDFPGITKGYCILQLKKINLKRPGASAAKQ